MSPTRSAASFLSSHFRQAVVTALQIRRAPYPRRNEATGGGVRPPSAPLRNVQRGIRIEALAVRARRSSVRHGVILLPAVPWTAPSAYGARILAMRRARLQTHP